jgi:hypothetical protein
MNSKKRLELSGAGAPGRYIENTGEVRGNNERWERVSAGVAGTGGVGVGTE